MENREVRTLTERYCPVVGHNVAFETPHDCQIESAGCLNLHNCTQERGGCRNRLIETNLKRECER